MTRNFRLGADDSEENQLQCLGLAGGREELTRRSRVGAADSELPSPELPTRIADSDSRLGEPTRRRRSRLGGSTPAESRLGVADAEELTRRS